MRILVAGAGTGGLVAAARLAELGFDVALFEKSAHLEDMRYDWHDDVAPSVFNRLNIPMPKESNPKRSWTFCTTDDKTVREFHQDETSPDMSIERRPLNKTLVDYATEKGVKIKWGVTVQKPIVKDGRVVGVFADGKPIEADFVVDSLGAYSPLRANLPKSMNITPMPEQNEVFVAYRAFFKRADGVKMPKYTNKVYLKHMNAPGISWSIVDHNPEQINVLIGRVAQLDDVTLASAMENLRRFNPIIGDEVVRGGIKCIIPVRYPLLKMVGDGYAAIGDAAFMTIPLLGSGIASSMLAGAILGETVGESMTHGLSGSALFDTKNLWKYQTRCYAEFGAKHCGVEIMKKWLLNTDMLDWMLSSKVLTNDDLAKVASGELIKLNAKMAIEKIKVVGIGKIPVLMRVLPMLIGANYAYACAKRNIPKYYNCTTFATWERQMKRILKKKR